jgi:thiol-disulfide isomerase/thioredoxin
VVVVEFWTFACINCRHTLPAMRELAARADRNLAVIGIHTPELPIERDPAEVRRAIVREHIVYPVATDEDYGAWNAFHTQYWPAFYVLDRRGRVRWTHAGELHLGTPEWRELLKVVAALEAEPVANAEGAQRATPAHL